MSHELKQNEVSELLHQTAALTAAGLPLASGLRAMAAEWPRRRSAKSIRDWADRLDSGETLERLAQEETSGRRGQMPVHLREVISAGAVSGRLTQVLASRLHLDGVADDLRKRFWTTASYPLILMIGCLLIGTALAMLILSFKNIFTDFGINTPRVTFFVMTCAENYMTIGWRLFLGMGMFFGTLIVMARLLLKPAERDYWINRLPLIGRTRECIGLAEFCRTLSLLIDAQLPLPKSLRLAGQAGRDQELREVAEVLAINLESGNSFAQIFETRSWRWLNPLLKETLIQAENSQGATENLTAAGELFEEFARSHHRYSIGLLTAMAFAYMLLTIVISVLALLLPVMALISALAG